MTCPTSTPPSPPTPVPPADPEWTLEGTVHGPDGAPLQGVHVRTGSPYGHFASGYTDADGRYTLAVVSGTYRPEAHWSGHPGTPSRVVSVPPSQAGVDLGFPAFSEVTGTVRDHVGLALEGIEVWAGWGFTTTNAFGAYAMRLTDGNYCTTVRSQQRPASPPARVLRVPPGLTAFDFTFPRDFEVSGTVLDFDGTPISGAEVRTDALDPWAAEDWSDSAGQYALYLVTDTYTITAFVADHAYTAQAAVSVPPDHPGTDLAFAPGYCISGTVRDAGGLPMEGVGVHICPSGGGGPCAWQATDAEGRYRLPALAGTWQVAAEKGLLPGPPAVTVSVPPDQVIDFRFPPPRAGAPSAAGYTIAGTVRDNQGNPVPHAGVGAGTAECCWAARDCTSPTGAYTLPLDEPGTYLVRSGSEVRLVTVPPSAIDVDLTWYAVEGTVLDETGQPLAGVLVRAPCGYQDCSGFSDVDGRYRLHLPPGTYQLTAEKSGHPQPPPRAVSAPPGGTGVDFVMPTGLAVSGVVLDGDGLPLEGATVVAAGPADPAGAESDACGIYSFWLATGTYTLTAGLEGYTSPPAQVVTVPPDLYDLDWQLEPEPSPALYSISGTVRDSPGAPVSSAMVCADKSCTSTDAQGFYQIEAPADTYDVYAWKEGYGRPPAQAVSVPPDQAGVDFTLPLLFSVLGTVRDGGGQPPAAEVTAREPTCGTPVTGFQAKDGGVYTLTLAAGTYEIGAFALTGSDGGYASTQALSVTVPPAAQGVDLTIPLPVRYTLSGSVRDGAGSPLSAAVSAAACGRLGSVGKAVDGVYSLEVPAGTWFLTAQASAAGYGSQSRAVVVNGDTSGLDWILTLEPEELSCCAVYGRVADEAGQPLQAEVQVLQGPGDGRAQASFCGLYRLPLDPPGTYLLRAVRTGYETVTQTATVASGATWVEWGLPTRPTAAQLSGTVRDETGQPLPWAVWIHGLDEFYEEVAKTDTAGRYIINLPAGSYQVEVEQHPCYTDRPVQEVTVPPDALVDLTFGHRLAYQVTGRVSGTSVWPLYGAVVSAQGEAGSAAATSDSNGTYRLRLSAGAWSLSAAAPPMCSLLPPPPRWLFLPPGQAGVDWQFLGQTCLPEILSAAP